MVARKLLVVALAATLLIGGVAATGAASVQDAQPDEEPQDEDRGDAGPPDNTTQYDPGEDPGNDSAADRGNGSAPDDVGPDGERGPPTDMPAHVPDHVVQIHQAITDFLNGEVDDLGATIADIVGEDGEAEDDDATDDGDDAASDEDAESEEDADSDDADDEPEDDAGDDADDADEDADDSDDSDADDADA